MCTQVREAAEGGASRCSVGPAHCVSACQSLALCSNWSPMPFCVFGSAPVSSSCLPEPLLHPLQNNLCNGGVRDRLVDRERERKGRDSAESCAVLCVLRCCDTCPGLQVQIIRCLAA